MIGRKLGIALACVLLAAVVYAATNGAFDSSTQSAVVSDGSSMMPPDMMMALNAAVASDQPVESLASELPAHDPTVGKLAGSAGTSGGAASYSIPIAMPPGRRGMQSSLSLDYSSRAGNGIAGMGWSLSGLSSLHRCPATLDQDNSVRAVALTNADKLCLDGQRLVATAGTYGQPNATYDTELESFVRVTQLGGDLQSTSTYFKVETKSGDILWYGNDSTGTHPAPVIPGGVSVPLSWMLVRKEDRVGNFMRYSYTNYGNGEVLVNSVVYTGFGTTDGDRHVDFTYQARPTTAGANDSASSYIAGGLTMQTQRLATVTSYYGTQAVRQYALRYDNPSAYTGRSLLRGVKDCGFADGSATPVCHPETTFGWQESGIQSSFHAMAIPGLPTRPMSGIYQAGDLDGDGVQEIVATYSNPNESYLISPNADGTYKTVLNATTAGIPMAGPSLLGQQIVDFNKDGRTDTVFAKTMSDGSIHIKDTMWNGTTSAFTASAFTTYDLGVSLTAFCSLLTGDVNGDGFTDLIVTYPTGSSGICQDPSLGNGSPQTMSVYLGKAGTSAGVPALQSTPAITQPLPYDISPSDGRTYPYIPSQVQDFDGDGLADIFLSRGAELAAGYSLVPIERDKSQRLWFSRMVNGVYTAGSGSNQIGSFAAFASTPLEADETNLQAFTRMADVNGDGLPDLVSIKIQPDGKGYWSVRLNNGGHFGPRMVTTSRRGIEICADNGLPTGSNFAWGQCTDRWDPEFAPLLTLGDSDNDGRADVLAPRAFAARICTITTKTPANGEPYDTYICPQNPLTGEVGRDEAADGGIYLNGGDRLQPLYAGGSARTADGSAYFMDALHFVQTGPTTMSVALVNTPIVYSALAGALADSSTGDLHGRGLTDTFAPVGVAVSPAVGVPYWNSYPFIDTVDPTWGPANLPDGTPVSNFNNLVWQNFTSENLGAGMNPDGKTPELADLMSMVTDGFGAQTVWTYYPLSSTAGRTAGQTPLYSIPSDPAQRYVDDRDIYFASTMPVVSDMAASDGIGGFHALRYGYNQAMYQTHGRGFQGFRTIIEEDLTAGLRTTTIFNQKFPLVSKVQEVFVNALASSGTNAPLRHELYTWRCNLANRSDTTACAPPNGTAAVMFPYLDKKETFTFDATVALTGTNGMQIGYSQDVNAYDSNCDGTGFTTASGFDSNGNLTGHTVLSSDSGASTGGFRTFVKMQCNQTVAIYAPPDTLHWWLDQLNKTTTTSAITYNTTNHPLPTGTSNPTQTVTTSYLWNADRTLKQESVQPAVAKQQRITTYAYTNVPNYGLPTGIAVAADGDPNGTRSSGIAYSSDGYFPYVMNNALSQSTSVVTGARDGQPTLTLDANGMRTLMTYDPFGQRMRTQFHGTDDSVQLLPDKNFALSWCNGVCLPGPQALYKTTVEQDGAPTQIVAYDLLGRELLTASRNLDGGLPLTQTQYDALGHVAAQIAPYYYTHTQYATTFQYDPLGRVTQKIVPKGAEDGRGDLKTTYTYSGLQTAIKVCGTADVGTTNCLNMTRTTDSMGRYMETTDAATPSGLTQYWTDAGGHTLALKDAKGSITTAAYNAIGQRSSVSDPNQGTWSFVYDALGELLTQTDARGIVTSSTYDKLSRPLSRNVSMDITGDGVADAILDSWTYDPLNGVGEAWTSQRTVNTVIERKQTYFYDTLARPNETDTIQQIATGGPPKAYTQTVAYDGYYGRPKSTGYPNGQAVATYYSKYGHPIRSFNPASGAVYREVTAVDARGNPTVAQLGVGLLTDTRSYRPSTGELLEIATTKSGAAVRQLDYQSDVFGNLKQQSLNSGATVEAYTYDNLQRMTQVARTGAVNSSVAYAYDVVGNFTSKSDFSTTAANAYNYASPTCGGGPNAVKKVTLATGGSRTYCYDADGNLTSDSAGLAIKYDHDNLAYVTTRGASTINLAYGPDNQRTREWGSDGTKVFLDGGYEDWISAGSNKIYVGTEAEITKAGATITVNYLLTDRLGSVDSIADSTGALVETRGSDAFGKPRSGTWADLSPARIQSMAITGHGFTGHEHLNSVELIHMNGRVYDYALGKFLSVDPFIQFPLNSQSLNPYSYILNNPLAGRDPTGYTACDADEPCHVKTGQTRTIQQEVTGSHIKETVGTATGNNDGSVSFSISGDGPGATQGFGSISGGNRASNGANNVATTTSSSGSRQDQAAGAQNKGDNSALGNLASAPQSAGSSDPWHMSDEQTLANYYQALPKVKALGKSLEGLVFLTKQLAIDWLDPEARAITDNTGGIEVGAALMRRNDFFKDGSSVYYWTGVRVDPTRGGTGVFIVPGVPVDDPSFVLGYHTHPNDSHFSGEERGMYWSRTVLENYTYGDIGWSLGRHVPIYVSLKNGQMYHFDYDAFNRARENVGDRDTKIFYQDFERRDR